MLIITNIYNMVLSYRVKLIWQDYFPPSRCLAHSNFHVCVRRQLPIGINRNDCRAGCAIEHTYTLANGAKRFIIALMVPLPC